MGKSKLLIENMINLASILPQANFIVIKEGQHLEDPNTRTAEKILQIRRELNQILNVK
jgi:hypothetical protein